MSDPDDITPDLDRLADDGGPVPDDDAADDSTIPLIVVIA